MHRHKKCLPLQITTEVLKSSGKGEVLQGAHCTTKHNIGMTAAFLTDTVQAGNNELVA